MSVNLAAAPKRGELRDHILGIALHLFSQKGYFNTSVHDIQRAARVSIGSIYNHFGGKAGIAKALYADLVARMSGFVDGVTAAQTDTYSRGRAVVQGLFEMMEADPEASPSWLMPGTASSSPMSRRSARQSPS